MLLWDITTKKQQYRRIHIHITLSQNKEAMRERKNNNNNNNNMVNACISHQTETKQRGSIQPTKPQQQTNNNPRIQKCSIEHELCKVRPSMGGGSQNLQNKKTEKN
jgi:hypothetical protein